MSDEGHDAMLAQFQDVTGLEDAARASFYLESAGWNLEIALGSFYEGNEEVAPAENPEPEEVTPSRVPTSGGGVGANVRTVGASADKESDSSEDEGQAFYAGGSSTSGQQILGPPKKKKGEEFVKDLFKKAREAGAVAVDPSTSKGKNTPHAFTGTGFKLGSTEASSEKVAGPEPPKPPRQFVLKMWRNGFSIDEGELRPYNDPENRVFLASVMTGRIPNELVSMAEGGEVHVDMEDHKEMDFVAQKGGRKAFTGSGHVLGGIAPSVVSASASASSASAPDPDAEKKAQEELKLNGDEPTTSIQVRLPDGKRLVARVNHSHTVGDLRRFVSTARPDFVSFSLHTTFPPKELSDDSATIQAAGLVGAAVLLRQK